MASSATVEDVFEIRARVAVPEDLPYISECWLRAMRPEYRDMRSGDFYDWYRPRIEALMAGGLVVAHPDGEPTVIHGWMAFNVKPLRIHFVYVRPQYRRCRIAARLVRALVRDDEPYVVTAMTDDARRIRRTHEGSFRYIPL